MPLPAWLLTVTVRETEMLRTMSARSRVISEPLGGAWAPERTVKSKLKDCGGARSRITQSVIKGSPCRIACRRR